eukprot:12028452-Heterocapsa_arctica.AAC.1
MAVLQRVYPAGEDVAAVVGDIRQSLAREAELSEGVAWRAVLCPAPQLRRQLLVGLGVAVSHQLSGINAV